MKQYYKFHKQYKPNRNGNIKEELVFRSHTYKVDDYGKDYVGCIYVYTLTEVVGFEYEVWGQVRYADSECVAIHYHTQDEKQKLIEFLNNIGAKEREE